MPIRHRKNPDDMWIAAYKPDKDHIYLGRADARILIYLQVHRKGLVVHTYNSEFRTRPSASTRPRRYIVPGEYSLEDVVTWIHSISGHANGRVGWLRGHWKIMSEAVKTGRARAFDGDFSNIPYGWVLAVGAKGLGLQIVAPSYEKIGDWFSCGRQVISGFGYGEIPRSMKSLSKFSVEHGGFFLLDSDLHEKERASRKALSDDHKEKRLHDIRSSLLESGIWERRGRLDWNVPPTFFDHVPLARFVIHSSISPRSFWKHFLTREILPAGNNTFHDQVLEPHFTMPSRRAAPNGRAWKKYEADVAAAAALAGERRAARALLARKLWREQYAIVSEKIRSGEFPESLCSIRGWDRLALEDLFLHVQCYHVRTTAWGSWVGSLYPIYKKVFHNHRNLFGSEAPMFERIVAMLNGLPRSEESASVLDECMNYGVPLLALLEIGPRTPQAMKRISLLFERLRTANPSSRKVVFDGRYKPPHTSLPEGWKWADHHDFWTLSNLYHCCISNVYWYERGIVSGVGHVLYRPDVNFPFLAYVKWDGDKWKIFESAGMGNDRPTASLLEEAHRIVDQLPRHRWPNLPQVDNDTFYRNPGRDERERRECEIMLKYFEVYDPHAPGDLPF